jgi:cell division protein FtsZ
MNLDALKFAIQEESSAGTKIRVIGVGGGGCNAVTRMYNEGVSGVEFYLLNTDVQALHSSPVPNKLAIGSKVTGGLGAGSDPAVGRQAALEDTERIIDILNGADMVFVTAGLGGGTGTGAAPVVASLAKEMNALTVAVVTTPFLFEGPKKKRAEQGLLELAGVVDTIITIPNQKLLSLVPEGTSFFEAFRVADDVLRQAVQGISDIIVTPGLINRDFSDIRAIMLGMGYAMMGSATASGKGAAVEAARRAINSPLMDEGGMKGARGVLINIMGSSRLSLHDVNEACSLVREAASNEDVQLNFGVVLNEDAGEEVKITVIATGFEAKGMPVPRAKIVEAAAAGPMPTVEEVLFGESAAETEPDPEPMVAAAAAAAGLPTATAPVATPAPVSEEVPVNFNDLDTPAFLRRDRRYFQ